MNFKFISIENYIEKIDIKYNSDDIIFNVDNLNILDMNEITKGNYIPNNYMEVIITDNSVRGVRVVKSSYRELSVNSKPVFEISNSYGESINGNLKNIPSDYYKINVIGFLVFTERNSPLI